MATNFWELLQQHQGDLTKSGRTVADYLVQHAAEAQYLSISSLAKECCVAEATVFRFCRALGFEGYHEMRIALAQANATGVLVNQQEPAPDADTATLCEHASALFMTAINGTQNALSPEAVDQAVALLRQAKQLMPELKVGVLVYGALETMALPTSTWEMLGLQNGLEEDDFPQLPPLSVENVDDENCSWALGWMGNQISMLQANFPGKSLVEVAQRLLEQRDPVKYVQTLDFKPDWVSCEYHTAYQQPSMVQKLHDLGIKAAYWTVDGEQAVKDLWPLQPDAIVTNRPDRVREWISELEMTE